MEEQLITLETAKLLKEIGFNECCAFAYIDSDLHLTNLRATNSFLDGIGGGYTSPFQSIVQRWLREIKNLHIAIIRNACGYGYDICKADNGTFIAAGIFDGPNDGGQWDTYEEALETGIQEALKLLKEE